MIEWEDIKECLVTTVVVCIAIFSGIVSVGAAIWVVKHLLG